MQRHMLMELRKVHRALRALIRYKRDAEWSRTLGVETGKVLTPAEAAKWLEQDRVERARHVADSARSHGAPRRY